MTPSEYLRPRRSVLILYGARIRGGWLFWLVLRRPCRAPYRFALNANPRVVSAIKTSILRGNRTEFVNAWGARQLRRWGSPNNLADPDDNAICCAFRRLFPGGVPLYVTALIQPTPLMAEFRRRHGLPLDDDEGAQ